MFNVQLEEAGAWRKPAFFPESITKANVPIHKIFFRHQGGSGGMELDLCFLMPSPNLRLYSVWFVIYPFVVFNWISE